MTRRRRFRPGFTMVELLTVIAIIAILAAIIFPVFSVVRKNVHKAQCTANLHSISQAIKMYKDDYRLYPDALYGYGFSGAGGRTFLFPQYIKDKAGFRCPLNSERTDSQKLLPGVNGIDGQQMAQCGNGRVRYPGELCQGAVPLTYFAWDSYDGSAVPTNATGGTAYVVHYLKKFTEASKLGAADEPRQLLYRNPPDNTVVTWCTYHRDYSSGQPQAGSLDLVLYLDGRVKPVPVTQTVKEPQAHTVTPSS